MSDPPDIQDLARRYLDLWQQYLTQAAADPDTSAAIARLSAMLAPQGFTQGFPGGFPGGFATWPLAAAVDDGASTNRTAPARPASGGGVGDLDELSARLAALEERLDAVERKPAPRRQRTSGGTGKRKS